MALTNHDAENDESIKGTLLSIDGRTHKHSDPTDPVSF